MLTSGNVWEFGTAKEWGAEAFWGARGMESGIGEAVGQRRNGQRPPGGQCAANPLIRQSTAAGAIISASAAAAAVV